jgi:hypothetical protein
MGGGPGGEDSHPVQSDGDTGAHISQDGKEKYQHGLMSFRYRLGGWYATSFSLAFDRPSGQSFHQPFLDDHKEQEWWQNH